MDIHPSQGPIHSFKDFVFHLLTVIIGILIALSLEGLLDWHHHRMLVQEARSNLASEIGENRRRLTKGLASAPDAEKRLKATIEAIDSYRKNHNDRSSDLDWSFGLFPLNATAWSTAASTGAVSYMNYSEVQDYTRVYVVQEQFLSLQQRTLEKWLELSRNGVSGSALAVAFQSSTTGSCPILRIRPAQHSSTRRQKKALRDLW